VSLFSVILYTGLLYSKFLTFSLSTLSSILSLIIYSSFILLFYLEVKALDFLFLLLFIILVRLILVIFVIFFIFI